MSGFLADSNVLLDVATSDPVWQAWSAKQLRLANLTGLISINPIIYAEIAPSFNTQADLDQWLDPAVFRRTPLPFDAGWIASQAFVAYRRAGGQKASPLADFYIGAHATVEGLTLITRDAGRYRTCFPTVTLIVP